MIFKDLISFLRQRAESRPALKPRAWVRVPLPLSPHLVGIQTSKGELEAAMALLEARFLTLSTALEKTTTTGSELILKGESLIALALGQGGGELILETSAEHIRQAIAFVDRTVQESNLLIDQLNLASNRITLLIAAEHAMKRALAPLAYVQKLFRIESAHLDPAAQLVFQTLVAEMERVRQRVEQEFHDKFRLIRHIQAILCGAIAKLAERSLSARLAVTTIRDHLTKSLLQVKEGCERNRTRETRLAGVSRALGRESGQIVMSLQFQDAFTQRLQHTQKILEQLEAHISSAPADSDESHRTWHFHHQSCLIVRAQLEAMTRETHAVEAKLNDDWLGILKLMADLDSDCLALKELEDLTIDADGAVQMLLDSLAEVQQMATDSKHFAVQSCEFIKPIAGLTTDFAASIRTLSYDIKLIGLNAEIQSVHLGEGTGLVCLSAETSRISGETTHLGTKLAVELDALTAGLAEIVRSFEEIREGSVEFHLALTTDAASDTLSLHGFRDGALTVLHEIGGLLDLLTVQVQEVTGQTGFAAAATEPLLRLQNVLATFAADAKSAIQRYGLQFESVGLTDQFLKLYTMSAEVDVHYRALGLQPPPPPEPPSTADLDMFGFDDPAPASGDPDSGLPSDSSIPPRVAPGVLDSFDDFSAGIELFDSAPSPETGSSPADVAQDPAEVRSADLDPLQSDSANRSLPLSDQPAPVAPGAPSAT